ncbi:MAG: hypothetical protein BZY81_04410 [SAR202 cluster bacterium Io17-Chloro-G4]|nr:MAG: hypothetical protein BZY81_04410 [SAR202 cluster bacterium Io17-Chloro-G4]
MESYPITIGDGRTTEELVLAANYGYAHTQVITENFPARRFGGSLVREIVLLAFDHDISSGDATTEAAGLGLDCPYYEDALYFAIKFPEVQLEGPVAFLHDPWFGWYGRRDVICLWNNAGRRELGLEGFDNLWTQDYRLAFVRGN